MHQDEWESVRLWRRENIVSHSRTSRREREPVANTFPFFSLSDWLACSDRCKLDFFVSLSVFLDVEAIQFWSRATWTMWIFSFLLESTTMRVASCRIFSMSNSSSLLTSSLSTSFNSSHSSHKSDGEWIITGLSLVIFVLALLGNTAALVVMFGSRGPIRLTNNKYLMNLACADLLRACFMPFTIIARMQRNFMFGPIICKVLPIVQGKSHFMDEGAFSQVDRDSSVASVNIFCSSPKLFYHLVALQLEDLSIWCHSQGTICIFHCLFLCWLNPLFEVESDSLLSRRN